MPETYVAAAPYPWPYNGDLRPQNTVLIIIDMQTDFCGVGGYVDKMGYDLSLTRAPIEPIKRLLIVLRAQGFHIIHKETGTVRIEWSDGTYTDAEWVDHLTFNTGGGTEVFTDAHQESGNRYTADGVFISQSTIRFVEHSTVTDGVVRVDSFKVRVGC